jgi:hypothetical protein
MAFWLIPLVVKALIGIVAVTTVAAIIITWSDMVHTIRSHIANYRSTHTVTIDARSVLKAIQSGQHGTIDIGLHDKGNFFRDSKIIDRFSIECSDIDQSIKNRLDARGFAQVPVKEII